MCWLRNKGQAMARSGKTDISTGSTKLRATPAGPKSRSKTDQAAPNDAQPSKAEAVGPRTGHLRAVVAEEVMTPAESDAATQGKATAEADSDPRFKRQALLEAVCARTPMKRGEVKTLVELVLDELGHAIDRNDELILPPLGKLSIKRRNAEGKSGDLLNMKLKRTKDMGVSGDDAPLAAAGEDG